LEKGKREVQGEPAAITFERPGLVGRERPSDPEVEWEAPEKEVVSEPKAPTVEKIEKMDKIVASEPKKDKKDKKDKDTSNEVTKEPKESKEAKIVKKDTTTDLNMSKRAPTPELYTFPPRIVTEYKPLGYQAKTWMFDRMKTDAEREYEKNIKTKKDDEIPTHYHLKKITLDRQNEDDRRNPYIRKRTATHKDKWYHLRTAALGTDEVEIRKIVTDVILDAPKQDSSHVEPKY
jgi:hypothetical protein